MFVQSVLCFSYHIGSNTSPMKRGFFPHHLNKQYTGTNMNLPCFSALKWIVLTRGKRPILWHLKWWLKFQKQSSYLQHSRFTDTEESCRGTLCLGSSFSKRTQLTTLIQKSYSKKSKTFQHSVIHLVWSCAGWYKPKSQKEGLSEKLLVWLAFTLARALAAQVLIRQLLVGSCLLPNSFIWIECRTNEVLDTGCLSLNLAKEEQLVAQFIWVPRSHANPFVA